MSKVIIFYPHIGEYGGIERNILALAEEVIRMGLVPVLVCYYDLIGMSKYLQGLEVVEIGEHWSPFTKAFRLRHWLDQNLGSVKGRPFFMGGKAGFYGGMAKISSYVLHYTDPPSLLSKTKSKSSLKYLVSIPKSYISNKLMQLGVNRAEVCITMTKWNAKELNVLYKRPFNVIYQGGVPLKGEVNNKSRCMGVTLKIFSICRLTASKNLDWIFEAIHKIQLDPVTNQWFKNIEVIIAGKGPQFLKLKEQAIRMGLNKIVQFSGFLTPAQVEEVYANTDLFLVPGRQGFGLPVLEALYRRVPVVLNKESRVSEILESNAWIAITENSSESFSNKVINHIKNLRQNYPDEAMLKNLPTEQAWANEIGKECKWW